MPKNTEITYKHVNWAKLAETPHHMRGRLNAVVVDGVPKPYVPEGGTQQFVHTKDEDGRTIKNAIPVWRGVDKKTARAHRPRRTA